jgi:hypothetical protein
MEGADRSWYDLSMSRRETRHDIERALAEQRRKLGLTRTSRRMSSEEMALHLATLREVLDPEAFAKVQSQFLRGSHKLFAQIRRKRPRPGDGSMPALVEPPRGPKPLAGGAAAPLEFD